MKKLIILAGIILSTAGGLQAQGLLDKIDRSLNKADRASNSAERAGKTGERINGLFGKKKDANAEKGESSTKVILNGITLVSLKRINEKIQSQKSIAMVKMKYHADGGSTLTINHSGSTEELLKNLQKSEPAVFADENIVGLDDGEITVRLNKKS
ncbi:hypothetical protein [Pedobacter sp. UBA5917]|jgi:hypothetical protein|uniref:hypothetical protein n=1 Tax=Pedobacter sp. UBA5917 TaxID=1947061 RepID=UPI0025F49633|nr:hypothetical protein [Pedobacter sp. UBA5917]